jgi:hypothetical protein
MFEHATDGIFAAGGIHANRHASQIRLRNQAGISLIGGVSQNEKLPWIDAKAE